MMENNSNPNWERQALEHLLLENLKETRKARRWRVVLRILTLLVIIAALLSVFDFHLPGRGMDMDMEKHTALVMLEGEISSSSMANAMGINSSLAAAFENENSAGVVMRINSPGGSPVQAGMINDEVHRLRKLYPNKPFYVVVEDICASGGYYVAAAADQILVDKASLVGSIGVIMEGFTGLMDKLGVTRRMITAGSNKGMMDPFSKEDPKQVEMVKTMIDEIHQQFIAVVKEGRGARLKESTDLFSGRIWNGEQAVKIGLVDGYGTVDTVARDVFKAPDVLDYTMKENFAECVAKRFGAEAGAAAGKALVKTPDLSKSAKIRAQQSLSS